ncbi:MAG: MFS transporter [Hyphomicrobiales bacterium]|nr:MFS transporter [Hyphomicrobiales bacterium]
MDKPVLPSDAAAPPQRGAASFLEIFPSIILPMFIAVLDQTIVATALPSMASQLGDVERLAWIIVSYLIANTIAAPVYGRLGDVRGRARMMYFALGVMMLGSLGCALAPNVGALIAARIVQGLGGGGLMTLSQSLISESVPPRDRARYQGYLAAVVVFSNAFGPVVGGWLTSLFGWRSIFWINLPLGAAAVWFVGRLPKRVPQAGTWRFDTPGLLFFVLFVAPALVALEQIRGFRPSDLPMIGALLAVAAGSLVMLSRRELRIDHPLFPFSLLRNPTIWRSDAMAACHGAALVSLIAYLPVYLRVARGLTPTESGYFLLPISFGIGVGSLVTGRLVSRTGRTAIFPSIALIPVALGLFFVALLHEDVRPGALSAIIGGMSFFMGSVMGVVQVTVQNAAGQAMLGAAAGSVQFSRAIGASFGTALVGALMLAVFSARDPGGISVFADLLASGPDALAALAPDARALAQSALTSSFRTVFLTIDAFVALALFCAWSIPTRRL